MIQAGALSQTSTHTMASSASSSKQNGDDGSLSALFSSLVDAGSFDQGEKPAVGAPSDEACAEGTGAFGDDARWRTVLNDMVALFRQNADMGRVPTDSGNGGDEGVLAVQSEEGRLDDSEEEKKKDSSDNGILDAFAGLFTLMQQGIREDEASRRIAMGDGETGALTEVDSAAHTQGFFGRTLEEGYESEDAATLRDFSALMKGGDADDNDFFLALDSLALDSDHEEFFDVAALSIEPKATAAEGLTGLEENAVDAGVSTPFDESIAAQGFLTQAQSGRQNKKTGGADGEALTRLSSSSLKEQGAAGGGESFDDLSSAEEDDAEASDFADRDIFGEAAREAALRTLLAKTTQTKTATAFHAPVFSGTIPSGPNEKPGAISMLPDNTGDASTADDSVLDEGLAKTDSSSGSPLSSGSAQALGSMADGARAEGTSPFANALSFARQKGASQTPSYAETTRQVIVQLRQNIKNGQSVMAIQLSPRELGGIAVRLSFGSNGHVRGSVTADNPETLELLKKDSDALIQCLQDAGLHAETGSLDFGLGGQDSGAGQTAYDSGEGVASVEESGTESALFSDVGVDNSEKGSDTAVVSETYYITPNGVNIRV
ncbi:MAG: flagellar hook-length control protein FliK [Alphaproteobacteria bacterium]|nr:flagellar hook-length control protein FliK [Alphaproteobacteria bacterium]